MGRVKCGKPGEGLWWGRRMGKGGGKGVGVGEWVIIIIIYCSSDLNINLHNIVFVIFNFLCWQSCPYIIGIWRMSCS